MRGQSSTSRRCPTDARSPPLTITPYGSGTSPPANACVSSKDILTASTHVAALPDGRAISASDDKTLRHWDLASGQCLRVLEGHSAAVAHVAALPDGRAISASHDHTLRLWDLASGKCLRVLEGHARWVVHVAALPDGRAISASHDHTLRLWDLASGQCLRVLEGHSDAVTHVAGLPDGRVISASRDSTLRLWDLASGQVISGLLADLPISCLDLSSLDGLGVCGHANDKLSFFRIGSSAGRR